MHITGTLYLFWIIMVSAVLRRYLTNIFSLCEKSAEWMSEQNIALILFFIFIFKMPKPKFELFIPNIPNL